MCALYEYRIFLRQVLPVQRAESWYRQRLRSADTEPWTEEDLWAMLYLAARLNGKGLFSVRHLVVDEAQDVSALGLAALLWVTGTESITVVGDVRQKIKGRDYPSLLDEWEKAMPAAMRKRRDLLRKSLDFRRRSAVPAGPGPQPIRYELIAGTAAPPARGRPSRCRSRRRCAGSPGYRPDQSSSQARPAKCRPRQIPCSRST